MLILTNKPQEALKSLSYSYSTKTDWKNFKNQTT